jgi:GT2 family glycosyltransferase
LTTAAAASALEVGDVVVVDNASGDDTLDRLHRLSTRLTIMGNQMNVGFGTANNQAAKLATSDVLILLISDAQIRPEAARLLVEEVARHRGRCIAGPRLISPDGTVQRSIGVLPGPFDLAIRALGLHTIARWITRLPGIGSLVSRSELASDYESAISATEPTITAMVSGACLAIGRLAYEELGGFDERFFMYFEDADLCRRALRAGMAIRFVPDAVVAHLVGASSSGDYRFSPMHARSMRQYLEKWWGLPGAVFAILLLWLRLVGHAIVLHPGTAKAFRALVAAVR